jgi:hypothetical protein
MKLKIILIAIIISSAILSEIVSFEMENRNFYGRNKSRRNTRRTSKLRKIHQELKFPVCTNGFGIEGKCSGGNAVETLLSKLPDFTKELVQKNLGEFLEKLKKVGDTCVGDYSKADADKNLSKFNCNLFPVASSEKLGYFGVIGKDIPCPDKTEVKMCVVVDRCGTIGVAINGNSIKCLASAVGLGPMFTGASESVGHTLFAFSYHKKLRLSTDNLLVLHDRKLKREEKVETSGHVYFSLSGAIPKNLLEKVPVKETTLDQVVEFNGTSHILADFGKAVGIVGKAISGLKTGKSNPKELLQEIKKSGGELTIKFKGNLNLFLSKVNKHLPDLKFSINELTAIITTGSGHSKLAEGFYLKFDLDNKNLADTIKQIVAKWDVLKAAFEIINPDLSKLSGLKVSVVVSDKKLGFELDSNLIQLKCVLSKKMKKPDCDFSSHLIKEKAKEKWNKFKGLFKSDKDKNARKRRMKLKF